MKYLSYLIAVLMLPFAAASCGQKYDDYYTQAIVTLQVPDTIVPVEMQGTVVLKNLSDGRRYTVSAFRRYAALTNGRRNRTRKVLQSFGKLCGNRCTPHADKYENHLHVGTGTVIMYTEPTLLVSRTHPFGGQNPLFW